MPGLDNQEFVVAGTGRVWVADADGASAPTDLNDPTGYTELGYHTEDGVSVNRSVEILRIRSWQSKVDTRRERQSENFAVTFALQQWNNESVALAFGGGDVTLESGVYKYTPPSAADALDEQSLVVDVEDGDKQLRFVIPRGSVTEGVESQFSSNQEAVLPITFEAVSTSDEVEAWYFLSNSDVFGVSS